MDQIFLLALSVCLGAAVIVLFLKNRDLKKRLAASKSLLAGCMERAEGRQLVVEGAIKAIRDANPSRSVETLNRRLIKTMEELGEASEAFLNVTNGTNRKKKTWDDVREELADVAIVAIDMLLTPLPNKSQSEDELIEEVIEVVGIKVRKWLSYQPALLPGDDA